MVYFMDRNVGSEKLDLSREEYESVVSHPVDLGGLEAEVILSVFNIKGDCEIRTCYGDIYKTVNALRDYSKLLAMVCDTWDLHGFHRIAYEFHAEKLREIADKLQAGIGYDYDAAVARCEKQKTKKRRDDDVGGEALELGLLKAQQAAEAQARKAAEKENGKKPFPAKDIPKDDPWAEDI